MKFIKRLYSNFDYLNPIFLIVLFYTFKVTLKGIISIVNLSYLRWEPFNYDNIYFSLFLIGLFIFFFLLGGKLGKVFYNSFSIKIFTIKRIRRQNLIYIVFFITVIIQYYSLIKIIEGYGGLNRIFTYQAGIPSLLKELKLTPYYAIMMLTIPVYHLLWVLEQKHKFKFISLLILISIPFVIISRRSPIFFLIIPLLYYHYYYEKRTIKLWKLLLLGIAVIILFTVLVIIRLGYQKYEFSAAELITYLLKSPEFSQFDMLVITIENHKYLTYFYTIDYLISNLEFIREYYIGAAISKELFGFQYKGGAIPPTIVATAYLWGNIPGLIFVSILVGFLISFMYYVLKNSKQLVLLSGYIFYFSMQIISNGDIYIIIVSSLRYIISFLLLFIISYKIKITKTK